MHSYLKWAWIPVLILFLSCSNESKLTTTCFSCGAERSTQKKRIFFSEENEKHEFAIDGYLIDSVSHKGKYSVLTKGNRPYAFKFVLSNIKQGEYYRISVWKKGGKNAGEIILSDFGNSGFFHSGNDILEKQNNGWALISMDFLVPKNLNGKNITAAARNTSNELVYFDDFSVRKLQKSEYPDFMQEALKIYIDSAGMAKLRAVRNRALKAGLLQTGDDDIVDGFLFYQNKEMHAEVRLKGDKTDHLQGEKWSLRIKLKKKGRWHEMQKFSIQHPGTRSYLDEWVTHQLFRKENVLTTRYGFVPVILNGKNLGIFAYEEHFDNELIAYYNRPMGPIVKFDDNVYMQTLKYENASERKLKTPVFEAADFLPYKQNATFNNKYLHRQFTLTQDQLFAFKQAFMPASTIFDVNKLAKYLALIDLTRAYNALMWSNLRFYHNSMVQKNEPLLFDAFSGSGASKYEKRAIFGNFNKKAFRKANKEIKPIYQLFSDPVFVEKYIAYLDTFTTEKYINAFFETINKPLAVYEEQLKQEFPFYNYKKSKLKKYAREIRGELVEIRKLSSAFNQILQSDMPAKFREISDSIPELAPIYVNAYIEYSSDKARRIKVVNYNKSAIEVIGFGSTLNAKLFVRLNDGLVSGYSENSINKRFFVASATANFAMVKLSNYPDSFMITLRKWHAPNLSEISSKSFIDVTKDTNSVFLPFANNWIVIKKGKHIINEPYIVPAGYKLIVEGGAQIRFQGNGFILSHSQVFFNGEPFNPIRISAQPNSGQGIAIIEADGTSELNYVELYNLSSFSLGQRYYKGSITAYRSAVVFNHLQCYNTSATFALHLVNGDYTISNSRFNNCGNSAVKIEFGKSRILNTEFYNAQKHGVIINYGNSEISGCTFGDIAHDAIRASNKAMVTVSLSEIQTSECAIKAEKNATINITDLRLRECRFCFVAHNSRKEQPMSTINITRFFSVFEDELFLQENDAVIINNGDSLKGKIKSYNKYYIGKDFTDE